MINKTFDIAIINVIYHFYIILTHTTNVLQLFEKNLIYFKLRDEGASDQNQVWIQSSIVRNWT